MVSFHINCEIKFAHSSSILYYVIMNCQNDYISILSYKIIAEIAL